MNTEAGDGRTSARAGRRAESRIASLRSILVVSPGSSDPPEGSAAADGLLIHIGNGAERERMLAHLRIFGQAEPRPPLLVQISPLGCGAADPELDLLLPFVPDAVVLPDAIGGRDIARLGLKLAVAEAEHGIPDGATAIIARPADTAAGVMALSTLGAASRRLAGLLWDAGRLADDLGAAPDSPVLVHARLALLVAARAAGVPAFEAPCPAGTPADLVLATCGAARRDGFAGRLAATLPELAAVNAVFAAEAG